MPAPIQIPHTPVKSSAIASIGHHAPSQTMEVTYIHGGTYRYPGVSTPEHQSIMAAPSKGRAVNTLIKRRKLTGVRMDKPVRS
jgi:hypothetical protein